MQQHPTTLTTHKRRKVRRPWLRSLAALALLGQSLAVTPVAAAPEQQTADEQEILSGGRVVGRHFRQTGAGTGLGYDVAEPFFSAMTGLGGPTVTGFPVSSPFKGVDGCTYQDFQVVLLQECTEGTVQRANTFQILEEAGVDGRLEQLGIGKGQADSGATFDEAKRIRLGWLEDSAIRERYLSECGNGDSDSAIQLCGLPMNQPTSFGPFVSQRFQRIAFQRWLVDGPGGIKAGDISRILGGDLLKDTGVVTGEAIKPHAVGQPPALPTVSFSKTADEKPAQTGTTTPAPAAQPATRPAPAVAQRTIPLAYGFQGDFFRTSLRPQSIAMVKDASFGWAKQQVPWDQYEISQAECLANRSNCIEAAITGPIRYFKKDQLSFLDAVVNDLNGAGLSIMLSVVRAPKHHAAPGGHAPADPNTLRDFLQYLTGRYKGKVQAIETWNEQNLAWEWGGDRLWPNAPATPPQGVRDFVELQKAAYHGVKAVDPSITVVLPALTPTGLSECWEVESERTQGYCLSQMKTAIDDRLYLDLMYQVNGGEIKHYYDVVGVHPSGYNNAPDDWTDKKTVSGESFKGHGSFYIKRYQQLRDVQLKYGDTKPMWFTEVGWSVAPRPAPGYEYARENTEETRGAYLARLLEQVHLEAPYVTSIFLWNLNFRLLVPETDEKYGFGLINADGSRTPAYVCAADFVKSGNRITQPECRPTAAGGASAALSSQTPLSTETPTPTATVVPTESPTATPTPTFTTTATLAATETPSSTSIETAGARSPFGGTPTPSVTPVATATPTATATATSTATAVPTAVPTPVLVAAAQAPLSAPHTHVQTAPAAVGQLASAPPSASDSVEAPVAAPRPQGQREHLVVKGDTLYSIARRNSTSVEALVAANGLGSRDAVLPIGRRLTIPSPSVPMIAISAASPRPQGQREHLVVKGDTLYSIARRNSTSVEALVAANGLGSRDAVLPIGRTLIIR